MIIKKSDLLKKTKLYQLKSGGHLPTHTNHIFADTVTVISAKTGEKICTLFIKCNQAGLQSASQKRALFDWVRVQVFFLTG